MATIFPPAGDNGYTQYSAKNIAAGTLIEASGCSWKLQNTRNLNPTASQGCDTGPLQVQRYPVQLRDSGADIIFQNGTIVGEVPLNSEWEYNYTDANTGASCNSAAIYVQNCVRPTIRGWRVTNAWDAFRFSDGSDDFVLEDCWLTNARDDAVENDKLNSGTIRNCLFENVLSGISLDPSSSSPVDGSDKTFVIDGVMLRLKMYLIEGEVTHGSPVKPDSVNGLIWTPQLRIKNTVFAIERVDHNGYNRLEKTWPNMIESSNNYYLNLTDTPLPSDYPQPPGGWASKGWTLLQGQAARNYWDTRRAAFLNSETSVVKNARVGTGTINAAYVGSQAVTKIYLGNNLIHG